GKAEGRTAGYPSRNADEIASFSTQYNTEEDRATNVELAAQRIDGIVIQPGTSFSFSNSIMSRTTENGYVVAPSFASG
ncbi:VanW family protein, partial [Escherichia coli]